MLDPFTFYGRWFSAALDMTGTAHRLSQTLTASNDVVARRTAMMRDAAQSPLDGDYAELSRMIPEKIDAFGRAGLAIAADCWAIQSAILAQARQIGALAMQGRPPTAAELSAAATSYATFALRTFERAGAISAKGLAPIHASATANARRLKRQV